MGYNDKIYQISLYDFYLMYGGADASEIAKPIPLTEQWLLDFNAIEKAKNIFYYDRFRLAWKKSYNYWYVVDRHNFNYLTKIKFVHEWQNFVYAMNSEELKLKEKQTL